MSRLYQFVLNNWIMGKNEEYINSAFEKEYITETEKEKILETPQVK